VSFGQGEKPKVSSRIAVERVASGRMTPAERYILLGLRLGRHVDGLVDSYYGPGELSEQARTRSSSRPSSWPPTARRSWRARGRLAARLRHGLETYARVLAGEQISYSDEVEGCYGVRPERIDPASTRRCTRGSRSCCRRRAARGAARGVAERNRMPADKLIPVVNDVLEELRRRTQTLFGLPEGESLHVEEVHDEPWWAFNYYQGGRRSRVVINVDVPTTYDDVFELCAHEAYPGHHTERSTKEVTLVEERGQIEETINLVPTPQSVLAEGIAETAADVLGPTRARRCWRSCAPRHRVRPRACARDPRGTRADPRARPRHCAADPRGRRDP
jgi:Bacterial protein of unknown function (DUF885).